MCAISFDQGEGLQNHLASVHGSTIQNKSNHAKTAQQCCVHQPMTEFQMYQGPMLKSHMKFQKMNSQSLIYKCVIQAVFSMIAGIVQELKAI